MVRLLDWIICSDTNSLKNHTTGETVQLSPRGMDVLGYLIECEGRVVTSSELLDKFWSKSAGSDHSVHNAIAELRAALGDRARNPRYIKTYTKRGYALVAAPIEVATIADATVTPPLTKILTGAKEWRAGLLSVASLTLLCLAVFGLFGVLDEGNSPEVIFVAPFSNINVDPANQYWAEQLPASLIPQLSKITNLNVVSGIRDFAGGVDSQSGYPDSADYLLEGNIQQEDSRLRLQINLVNADDQSTVFSESYEISSDAVFEVHDDIGASIGSALSIYLDEGQREEMRNWGTTNPVAYSMFLKAQYHAQQSNHRDLEAALENYIGATNEDPDFVNAYIGIARIASSLGMYSHEARNIELRELVNNALRDVIRIAPEDDSIEVMRDLALRIEGTNKRFIEESLKDSILSGNAPHFVYSRYGQMLAEARLYVEAGKYFDLTATREPFELPMESDDLSDLFIQSPSNVIRVQQESLLDRSSHIAVLNARIRALIFEGNKRQAVYNLERLLEIDDEGAFSMLNQVIISGLWGSSSSVGDSFELANASNPKYHLSHGAKSFITGDVEAGLEHWRSLATADLRRLSTLLYKIEMYFSEEVLADPSYLALLEELDMGLSWQRRLMGSVREMSAATGVELHPQSVQAYNSNQFLINNNLWNHAEIGYPNRDNHPLQVRFDE